MVEALAAEDQKNEEIDEEDEKKKQEEKDKQIKCKLDHKLFLYREGKKRISTEDGTTRFADETFLKCESCLTLFEVDRQKGFASCKQLCNYFQCPDCSMCEWCNEILVHKMDKDIDDYGSEDERERNFECSQVRDYGRGGRGGRSRRWCDEQWRGMRRGRGRRGRGRGGW